MVGHHWQPVAFGGGHNTMLSGKELSMEFDEPSEPLSNRGSKKNLRSLLHDVMDDITICIILYQAFHRQCLWAASLYDTMK